MEHHNYHDKIKGFLDGDLPPQELAAFQQKMEADPEFAEDVRLFQMSRERLLPILKKEKEMNTFKALLDKKSEEYFSDNADIPITKPSLFVRFKQHIVQRKLVYSLATACILCIIFFKPINDMLFQKNITPVAIYEEVYSIPKADFTLLSTKQLLEAEIDQQFNSKKYDEALSTIEEYLKKADTNKIKALYFKGLCLQQLDKHTEAITIFKSISEEKSIYKFNSIWYLALSYLHEGNIPSCKEQLSKIPSGVGKHQAAQKLLTRL